MNRNSRKTCCAFVCLAIIAVCTAQQLESCYSDGAVGTCLIIKQCPALYSILKRRPLSPRDENFLKERGCGFIGKEPKVCCLQNEMSAGESTTYQPVQPVYTEDTNRPTDQLGQIESDLLPNTDHCGTSEEDRIVGGEVADIHEFPWMALVEYTKPKGKGFYCGGVLISSRYVLTAAHCVKGKDLPKTWRVTGVRLGEYDTATDVDCVDLGYGEKVCSDAPVDVGVEQIIPHEEYNPFDQNQYHDIALLRLSRSVGTSDFVRPICIPPHDHTNSEKSVGKQMFVAGWGKTETKSESNIKLKVKVPVKSNAECVQVYREARVALSGQQMCAGGVKGKDSCRGDSGGPLMAVDTNTAGKNNWYVDGVVSFGPSPCGMDGWPGVYTRVDKYTNWIISNLRP